MNIDIYAGDCLDSLKQLEDQSINTCITSPPYWGLRDYNGEEKQLGLEDTPEEFVDNLVKVFKEVKRVLRDDGTVWLNLGDSYAGNNSRASNNGRAGYGTEREGVFTKTGKGLKIKDLVGIPWRVAFALQQDGWYLRQDIIWHKPNPMPESVQDRCTKAHEYIFLLSKSQKYYFDNEAIKEDAKFPDGPNSPHNIKKGQGEYGMDTRGGLNKIGAIEKKNKRSVWTVTTKPFAEAHFATFPSDLIEPCILAGCPEKVCVDCGTPYKIKPKYKYSSDIEKKDSSFGKYGDQETESLNRQGMHGKRGEKLIQVRDNLPTQEKLVAYLKKKTNAKTLTNSTDLKLSKIEHWFRADESGFSYPSVKDWEKVREFIDDWSEEFEEIDHGLLDYELKSDAIKSKTLIGYELQKQCDCKTNETKAGTVLDPFGGSGTTAEVSNANARDTVLCELSDDYIEIAVKRLTNMFTNINIIKEKR